MMMRFSGPCEKAADNRGRLVGRLIVSVFSLVLLLGAFDLSRAAELVTNGNFNTSAGWTFTTTTFDAAATNTADGSGSGQVAATGRNTQVTGTIVQGVSLAAGSMINAATDVTAYGKHQSAVVASVLRTVKIQLRYVDLTTVEIFVNNALPDNSPWAGLANETLTAFPLTLAQDVDQIIITLDTKDGNNNSAASTLWVDDVSVTYAPPAGGGNTITSCAGCHDYPPADGSARNNPVGAVVGDHAKHNAYVCATCHVTPATETSADFSHRDGNITMDSGNIGVGVDNGTYSRGATFPQSNAPTTGTCASVDCHNNAVTPQWGVGTTACNSCHTTPPATGAHSAHYAAKGWANDETNCTACHPDNTAGHSDVTDGSVVVNAGLGYAGGGGSCAAPGGLGCHNDYATPNWSGGTATCTTCHTAGGANVADPLSGLHAVVPSVSGQQHNQSVTGGCTACHSGVDGAATHVNGTFTGDTVANLGLAAGINYTQTAADTGTCVNTSCHATQSDAWEHKWNSAANAYTTTPSACDGCHGDWMGTDTNFNTGVDHKATAGIQATHGDLYTSYTCGECHVIEATTNNYNFTFGSGDWFPADGTSNHGNGTIDINSGGSYSTVTNRCEACHTVTDGVHNFVDTGWSVTNVVGDAITASCTTCHGGGSTGSTSGTKNMWPDGSTGHAANTPGRHVIHMTKLAARVYGFTTLNDLLNDPSSDTKQKALCEYCHAANTNDSDHMNTYPADVFVDADAVRHAKSLWGAADADAAYNNVADTCSNVDCHNSKTTTDGTYGWYDAGTSACTMCHVGGTTDPTSGLHAGPPTITGKTHDDTLDAAGCAVCHDDGAGNPSTAHIDGVADASSPTINFAAAVGFTDGATPTCTASCHSDGGAWSRQWHANATATNGSECAGCHGGMTGSGSWNTGVLNHFQNWDGDGNTNEVPTNHGSDDNTAASRTTKCSKCHVYADTVNSTYTNNGNNSIGWVANASSTSTYHGNGKIDFDANRSYTTAGGCASSCHQDNTNHKMTASGWTLNNVSGAPELACTDCHTGTGTQQFKVGASSSHTDPDGGGATYAAGANNCAVCHFASHATRTTGTIGANWDTRTMGTDYTADGKIYLKKLAGTESYEAEICWNCHWGANMPSISPLIKEFGGTQGAYQTGTLSQRNWYGATWTSANFAYKTNTVASIHQAMSSTAVDPTIDTALGATDVGTIGCTSCHDVHQVGNNGFTPAGQPYLRGSWTSNPFKEDGAPQNGMTMSSDRGAVPRGIGSNAANGIGGWQIEQNNASFTNTVYSGASGFAGLCANCHTQGTLETKWSGHQGAVSGFTGGTGNNFLNPTARGNPTGDYTKGHMSYNNYQGTGRNGGTWVGGLRNARQWNDGIAPADIDSLQTTGTNITYPAGAVTTILSGPADAPQDNFHNFPCSKCHSPHASRLQRLMITNCLDVRHNTWDDPANGNAGNPSSWAPGAQTATELAYSTTAQNCHRYTGAGTGWNTITPW